jgi:two-component system sensor histidine kinase AlgZ
MASNPNPGRTVPAARTQNEGPLPDFCDGKVLLMLMLVAEGLAIVLTLSQDSYPFSLWVYLGNASIFIQCIALTDAAILCLLIRKLSGLSSIPLYLTLYSLLQINTILITVLAHMALKYSGISPDINRHLLLDVAYNFFISAIITGATLRYFYVRHQNTRRERSESEARIQALQARIRPHFLFNSLNTIANLIHQHADTAEEALLDLAELFRSTLGKESYISLEEELAIAQRYLRIEKLRLGERLLVDWDIPAELNDIAVPALMLQPLIENAIYHGIEPLPHGGHVRISARREQEFVRIEINNPLSADFTRDSSLGNQLALENIRQRLQLAYENQADLEQEQDKVSYTVALTLPIDRNESINR